MSSSFALSSAARRENVVVVPRHGRAALQHVASAAALMARADGSADEHEQQALLRFLRAHDLLRRFGRRDCLRAYQSELERAAPEPDVLDALGEQRGRIGATLVAAAAASIALADGAVHPAEIALLRHLAERLSVVDECDDIAAVLFPTQ